MGLRSLTDGSRCQSYTRRIYCFRFFLSRRRLFGFLLLNERGSFIETGKDVGLQGTILLAHGVLLAARSLRFLRGL